MTDHTLPLRVTRYVLCWPRFLGWAFPLLAVTCFFARDLRLLEDAVLVATWRPWFAARWKYFTALAAGWCIHPKHAEPEIAHERVHVRQMEDLALAGLVLAIVVSLAAWSPWGLLLWPGALVLKACNFLGAVLRGGHVYRDAEHERSAYAQTDLRPDGTSWLKEHESASAPRTW
jgi:hypothetical protein